MATGGEWDIVGFGVAAIDDVFIGDVFPAPGDKLTFAKHMRVGGGQTATALVAASRLGSRCFYAGHLGADDLSRMVGDIFDREGIGHRAGVDYPEARPTHTLVIVNSVTAERTILANLSEVRPADIGVDETRLVAGCRCLFADQSVPKTLCRAAAAARENGVPIVADLEGVLPDQDSRELYKMTDHLILPLHIAVRDLGAEGPEDAVRIMMRDGGRAVACVTDGDRGAWYAAAGEPGTVCRQPAFRMAEVVDTNGCGDVFHGAYADALVRGLPVAERLRRAAAAAALKTQKAGGQTGAPTAAELDEFLRGA